MQMHTALFGAPSPVAASSNIVTVNCDKNACSSPFPKGSERANAPADGPPTHLQNDTSLTGRAVSTVKDETKETDDGDDAGPTRLACVRATQCKRKTLLLHPTRHCRLL